MRPFFSSLRGRIAILLFLTAAPMLFLRILDLQNERALARAKTEQMAAWLGKSATITYHLAVEKTRWLLGSLAEADAIRLSRGSDCEQTLAKVLKENPRYTALGVTDDHGVVVCTTAPAARGTSVSDRFWYQRAREKNDFSIGDFHINRLTGLAEIGFGQPVFDRQGKRSGTLFVSLNLKWLEEMLRELHLPQRSIVIALDSKGILLARYPEHEILEVGKPHPIPQLRETIGRGSGILRFVGVDDIARITVYTQIGPSNAPITVIVGIPESDFQSAEFNRVDQSFYKSITFLFGLALLVLAVAWINSDAHLIRPIRPLLKAAQRLSSGDFEARSAVPPQNTELRDLAHAFNHMAESLSIRDAELSRWRRKVELQRISSAETAKLAAMGSMAGGIAHEINNPLAIVKISVDHLAEYFRQPVIDLPAAVKSVRKVRAMVERIGKILQGMEALTRQPGPLARERISLRDLLHGMEDMFATKADIPVIIEPFPKDLTLTCRATLLQQVVINLVNNAIDAVHTLPEKWVRISVQTSGQHLEIRVTDSGHGIPKEIRDKLFEPFFTTKDVGRGTGLGLSISKRIIEEHGGTLQIASDCPNTCFIARLPLS